MCVIKTKLKFEDCRKCLEVAKTENKIDHLEKNKIDVDSLKADQREFIKKQQIKIKSTTKNQK